MRNNKIPRWELWIDAVAVGFLFGTGVGISALPVLWMLGVI